MKLAHEGEYQYGHDTLLKWVDEWMQDGTGQVKQQRTEQFGTITAAELEEMAFAPVRWAVPDILPEGLTLFAGKQKMGKSWLALGLCVSVASGGVALGTRSVEKGDVLYLDLEGNQRRIKSRVKYIGAFSPNLHIATEWPNVDDGGIKALDAWLSEHPNCRLAVVDTLKHFRSRRRGNKNAYGVDYEDVEPLVSLAYKHKVSIVLVHHDRKDTDSDDPYDTLSGSTGLSAAMDGVMLLKRERGSAAAFLYVEGRDIESNEYALAWNTNMSGWTIEGDAPKYRLTSERREIIETL